MNKRSPRTVAALAFLAPSFAFSESGEPNLSFQRYQKGHSVQVAPIAVNIVDDDPSVRQALARLVQSSGMRAEVFETVPELLRSGCYAEPACVIADTRMPDVSGLELPGLLRQHGHRLPVIFVTAYDTEQNRSAAKRAGAVAFFHKPVDGQALLDAIAWAVEAAVDARSV